MASDNNRRDRSLKTEERNKGKRKEKRETRTFSCALRTQRPEMLQIINQQQFFHTFKNHSPTHTSSISGFPTASSTASSTINPFSPPPTLPSKVKLSPPSNYTGDRNVNVETWLFEINQYLDTSSVNLASQRIAVASGHFKKESALQWWKNQCQSNPNPISNWSWIQFVDAVKDRFQPLAASRTARSQLRNLRQSNMSVADYSHRFLQLVQLISDMSEIDHGIIYLRFTKPSLT